MANSLIKRLVETKRLPTLFIGSGISKRFLKNSPTWHDLLYESFKMVDPSLIEHARAMDECRRLNYSNFETYKFLGSRMDFLYSDYFFGKMKKDPTGKLPKWVKEGVSPFKIYLSDRFGKMVLKDNGYLQRELRLFKELSSKVSAIITTNFDEFIETHLFNEGFETYYKQSDLFKSERYNVAEIYKVHGTVKDASSIVITKEDYENFEKSRRLIIAKMLTLFSDSPIIFMGYSLDDDNIKNLIFDFLECIDIEDIHKLKDHFIFVEYKKDERQLLESVENIVTSRGTIPISKISTDNFTRLLLELNKITPGLPSSIVKKTSRLIKRIVENSRRTGDTNSIVIHEDQIASISDGNLAIAFGDKQSVLGRYGYKEFDIKNLFEDILFDNFNFVPMLVVSDRLSSVRINQLIPVFKYYDRLTEIEKNEMQFLNKFLNRSSYETIYGPNIINNLKNVPVFNTIDSLLSRIPESQLENIDFIFKFFAKSIMNFTSTQIRDFCIEYFNVDADSCLRSTFFKRAVMYLDVIENKKV